MSNNRDDMVITPRLKDPRDSGPRRRAVEARQVEQAKRKKFAVLRAINKAKMARRLQSARSLKMASKARGAGATAAKGLGKAGSRILGPLGVALLVMDAINVVGSTSRRLDGGVSGRLLEATDQDTIYGLTDELASGAAGGRNSIEGDEDLLRIIGQQGRVNSQIGRLGSWFRERETARAIGADLIEREPSFDYLESIADRVLDAGATAVKVSTDSAINAIRSALGKGALNR
jgi:hypothetical protein